MLLKRVACEGLSHSNNPSEASFSGKYRSSLSHSFEACTRRNILKLMEIVANFYFPYTGEDDLFKCRASTYSLSGYPEIELSKGFIVFTYQKALSEMQSQEDKEKLFAQLNRDLSSIKSGISYANNDVNEFNRNLRSIALKKLQERKQKVKQFFSISQMFEVPLKKSDFATTHIPMQRKIVPIATSYNNEQTYCISDAEYKFILDIIKHNGSTYERTPSSYRSMHEEDLRNTLLAALNGMYQGGAMGETFRNKGKTDICIEKDNRAAFVAECKMWTGQGAIANAVNQLDSYLTWKNKRRHHQMKAAMCKTSNRILFLSPGRICYNSRTDCSGDGQPLPFRKGVVR